MTAINGGAPVILGERPGPGRHIHIRKGAFAPAGRLSGPTFRCVGVWSRACDSVDQPTTKGAHPIIPSRLLPFPPSIRTGAERPQLTSLLQAIRTSDACSQVSPLELSSRTLSEPGAGAGGARPREETESNGAGGLHSTTRVGSLAPSVSPPTSACATAPSVQAGEQQQPAPAFGPPPLGNSMDVKVRRQGSVLFG